MQLNIARIKPGQGVEIVDNLNNLVVVHNGNGYEFWVEWQPQPDKNLELRAGYYLHAIYEYTQIDRSLTELSDRWRTFKYGIWLGENTDSATHNLASAIEITKRSFERRIPHMHTLLSNHDSEIIET